MTTTSFTSGLPPRSKLAEVCRGLTGLARQKQPGDRLPTVQSLCSRFDASWGTLDRALKELERRGVIDRQHGRGIFVAAGLSQATFGLLLGVDVGAAELSPYYRLVLNAARDEAARRDQALRIYASWSGLPDRAGTLQQLRLDMEADLVQGLILVGAGGLSLPRAAERGVPVVSLSEAGEGARVVIDSPEIVRTGVQALAAAGCKRLSMLAGREMMDQFRHELKQMGLEDLKVRRLLVEDSALFNQLDRYEQLGFEMVSTMFDRLPARRQPDGLLIGDDVIGRGALLALERRAVAVGQSLRVAAMTVRGSNALWCYEDALIRVELDPEQIVSEAYAMFDRWPDRGLPSPHVMTVKPVLRMPTQADQGA